MVPVTLGEHQSTKRARFGAGSAKIIVVVVVVVIICIIFLFRRGKQESLRC